MSGQLRAPMENRQQCEMQSCGTIGQVHSKHARGSGRDFKGTAGKSGLIAVSCVTFTEASCVPLATSCAPLRRRSSRAPLVPVEKAIPYAVLGPVEFHSELRLPQQCSCWQPAGAPWLTADR